MREIDMDLTTTFNENYQKIISTVSETLQQLFMREFQVSMSVDNDDNMAVSLAGEKYPALLITMKSSSVSEMFHMMLLEPAMVLQLYAWMIGDEPEEAVSEAQIEGFQEALTQIVSQIRIQFDGEGDLLEIEDISLVMHEDSSAILENIPGDVGVQATYIINVDSSAYSINHYVWVTGEGVAAAAGAEEGPEGNVNVSKADFENFMTNQGASVDPESMDLLLDVELEVVAELGKKIIPIKDLLKIGTGSVVELEKSAGEPLDLLINGRKFGEGEVVVVEDHFGIRITQLAGKKEKDE